MTEKDRHLFTELILTFSLLITPVFLLRPAVFWQYQQLLIGGSAVGFAFGWYNRKGAFAGIKYLTDAAILITIAWTGCRIFKSTFLYKDVLAILIQNVIILEIIFSFNFSAPGKTAYLWFLSLLVFLASAVLAAAYPLFLVIAYLLVWLGILRFQFAGFLHPFNEKGSRRYYSLATSLVCFMIAMLLAWFVSVNVYLGRINKGAFLLDDELQDSGPGDLKESNQADRFYSLQDDLQNKLTDLALKFNSLEKSRQVIYLFSELIKDTDKMMDVDKAQMGLVDILKREGAGLEGSEPAIMFIKNYLDKKNSFDLQQDKEDIVNMLKNYPLGIIDKIRIISLANKIQQSNSYEQLQENSRALQAVIQNAPLSKDAREDLSALSRKLFNLKAFELYRREVQNLEQRAPSLGDELEKKVGDLVSDIRHTQVLEDFKQTAKEIRQLKNQARILEQKSAKAVFKSLEEASRLKLDLFFTDKAEEVRKDAAQKQDLGLSAEEFTRKMDGVENAKNQKEFIKEFLALSQLSKDNSLNLAKGLAEMLDLKTEVFKQREKDKLDNLMGKDFSPEAKNEIRDALEAMEGKNNLRDLDRQLEELVSRLRELERKGGISLESATELIKAVADFKDLLDARLGAEAELNKEVVPRKGSSEFDYLGQLQQAIEDSSLSGREKEVLKVLSEQLFKAQSLSQLENVQEALEKEVSVLGKGVSDKDRMVLSMPVNKISADLEKKIGNLVNLSADQIRQLQESLKRMEQSQDARELQKAAQELKEAIKSGTEQDIQEQARMLEAVGKLAEVLEALVVKKAPTAEELKEINKINEKIKQAAEIKKQFLMSKALAEILEKIEKLALSDAQKAQALKDKIEQMHKSSSPEEVEKIILDLKNILNSKSGQEDRTGLPEQEDEQPWKIYILSSGLIVSPGVTVPLKVIAINANGYIRELTSDVEWFSTDQQVAWVDDLNFLRPLAKGKARIRVVYKGVASKEAEVNVVEDINAQTTRMTKRELAQ
ncbi:MAG: hypothetical protein ABIH91_03410 [Candidatus Omnitrophota bacterium]